MYGVCEKIKEKFQNAKIRHCLQKRSSQATRILRVNRRATASRYHPYIPSMKYADTKVPEAWVKTRNNIPEITNIILVIHDNVVGTKVKETYL